MAALWVGISCNSLWSDLTSCQERHPALVQEKPGSLHAGGIILWFCLYWLYPIDANTHVYPPTHTHTTRTYESSFISWLSVLAIFLGGAGLSPSACSCSLFFAAFCLTQDYTGISKITASLSFNTSVTEAQMNSCFIARDYLRHNKDSLQRLLNFRSGTAAHTRPCQFHQYISLPTLYTAFIEVLALVPVATLYWGLPQTAV